jgi:glycosyltransferase involved in cell wall biosynthesis
LDEQHTTSLHIPFVNAEKFIHKAIDSVGFQTYDRWELLLIDDGSTDASTEIAREMVNGIWQRSAN